MVLTQAEWRNETGLPADLRIVARQRSQPRCDCGCGRRGYIGLDGLLFCRPCYRELTAHEVQALEFLPITLTPDRMSGLGVRS